MSRSNNFQEISLSGFVYLPRKKLFSVLTYKNCFQSNATAAIPICDDQVKEVVTSVGTSDNARSRRKETQDTAQPEEKIQQQV